MLTLLDIKFSSIQNEKKKKEEMSKWNISMPNKQKWKFVTIVSVFLLFNVPVPWTFCTVKTLYSVQACPLVRIHLICCLWEHSTVMFIVIQSIDLNGTTTKTPHCHNAPFNSTLWKYNFIFYIDLVYVVVYVMCSSYRPHPLIYNWKCIFGNG